MTVLRLLRDGRWPVHVEGPLLAPEDVLAVQDATTLVEQCRRRCDEITAEARERAAHEVQAGLQRGLDEAAARCAARLLDYERAQQAEWDRREQETLSLVMLVLERLGPALAPAELVRTLVRQAVGEARQARRLLVKVHPDHRAAIEAELGALRAGCTWLESLEVVGAPELAADDCVLESPHGFINAGWATQLAAIRQVLLDNARAPHE